MDDGLYWVILLMYGSHDMRHTSFHRLTVVNGTPGNWGITTCSCRDTVLPSPGQAKSQPQKATHVATDALEPSNVRKQFGMFSFFCFTCILLS